MQEGQVPRKEALRRKLWYWLWAPPMLDQDRTFRKEAIQALGMALVMTIILAIFFRVTKGYVPVDVLIGGFIGGFIVLLVKR